MKILSILVIVLLIVFLVWFFVLRYITSKSPSIVDGWYDNEIQKEIPKK